jgi:hypothetical protein
MIFIFLALLVMYFIRTNEVLFQIIGKLVLWALIWTSFSMTAQALYNRYIPWGERYQLPLHAMEIAAYTKSDLTLSVGSTRDGQGNISGARLDMTVRITNHTDRVLDKATIRCRYASGENDFSHEEFVPIRVLPGQTETITHTWKSRNGRSPDSAHCYVKSVEELNQW